jgi:hypothetical protein
LIVRIRWTPVKAKDLAPRSKLLLGALLLAPGLPVSTIADVPLDRVIQTAHHRAPAESLTSFMKRNAFAEPYHVAEIIQAASEASIPPSMIVCIEFVESSGGKHYDAGTNNPLGWNNGKTSFPSVHAAIRHVSGELGYGRWYTGKSLEEKLRVYNPHPIYTAKVMDCMRQFRD